MFEKAETLESPTGASLSFRFQPAAAAEKGVLIVCHGLADHAARYQRFASFMAAEGYNVYAHDHRGHGTTTAKDAPIGRFAEKNGAEKVLDDVKAMRDMAAARHPNLPMILFGHSMGGLIALNAAEREPGLYDGLAVWNSNFNPGLAGRAAQVVLAIEKMLKGSDVPSSILPKLTFDAWGKAVPGHRTGFDWLSHDPVEVDTYIKDPLCGFDASVSLWIDLFDLVFAGAAPDRLKRLPSNLPIHLVGGGQDPATNGGREMRWLANRMSAAGLTHVTTVIAPTARHETLNDVGKDVAMRTFSDWCLTVVENRT